MSFQVGETVGRYRVVQQLGQGGMATVLKAYHAELDRYVAIKVLHPAFLEDKNFLARFQREARLVARLDHPNIVPIFDYSEHEGRPYLVMKFIEGETLKARLARGPLSTAELLTIVQAVGAALGFAHKNRILHRDIKPSNVLLAADGQIYLADFGLARIAQAGDSTLTSDMILGTPQYISPEQALGRKDLDEGTDIYSLGVMLYEIAVGKVPFSADTPYSIIHDHIYTPLPLPSLVNPSVTEEVERVLLKTLSKERAGRYADVESLVTAFCRAWQLERSTQEAGQMLQTQPLGPEALTLPPGHQQDPVEPEGLLTTGAAAGASAAVPRKGSLRWMWLAVAVLLGVCCLVAVLAVRAPKSSMGIPSLEPHLELTLAPLTTPRNLIDIGQARQSVQDAPEDPAAQMQLVLAYHQAGFLELEQEHLARVVGIAAGQEVILWESSRLAVGKEAWLSAARLAIEAASLHLRSTPQLPEDLGALLHETVYKAARNPLAGEYVNSEQIAQIDANLAKVAAIRFTFYNIDQAQGLQLMEEFLLSRPINLEARLLQAEFHARLGETDAARQALAELRLASQLQGWMLREIEAIEAGLP